jgi:cysteine desulfuration protein SufE
MSKLEEIINQFQSLDYDFRLDLLLDYAEKLPALPEKYQAAKEAGLNRVHECQAPVYLWVELEDGKVKLFADVAEEAPTVRGFISILVNTLEGGSPSEIETIPNDLLFKLGLGQHVGMVRVQGLSSIIPKIKKEIRKTIESESVS